MQEQDFRLQPNQRRFRQLDLAPAVLARELAHGQLLGDRSELTLWAIGSSMGTYELSPDQDEDDLVLRP